VKYRATLVCVLLLGQYRCRRWPRNAASTFPEQRGSIEQSGERFTYANIFIWYPSTKFKDQDGKTAIN